VGVEGIGEPAPPDGGQGRVGGHLGLDVGAGKRHTPEGAAPGVVAGRVVQQDESPGAELVVAAGRAAGAWRDDVTAHRVRERGDALRGGHGVDHNLGAQHGAAHLLDCCSEGRGSAIDLASDTHPVIVGVSAVKRVPTHRPPAHTCLTQSTP
jgi:hypothetical protein